METSTTRSRVWRVKETVVSITKPFLALVILPNRVDQSTVNSSIFIKRAAGAHSGELVSSTMWYSQLDRGDSSTFISKYSLCLVNLRD